MIMATRRTRQGKTIQKTIHFDEDVWEALEKHMSGERLYNVSAATNDAVRYALFPEHRDDRDGEVLKAIHQVQAALSEHRKKTSRDLSILQEVTLQFLRQFLMHTKAVPRTERTAAETQANTRLDQLMENVMRNIGKIMNNQS